MNFEELHPDLRSYLRGDAIEHPLVSWPYAFPAYHKRLNQCYLHQVQIRSGTKQQNSWDQYYPELTVFERTEKYTTELFSDQVPLDDRFTRERLEFFGQCWTSPDLIAQTSSFCELMTDAPFDRDISAVMTEQEIEEWTALPAELEVYRASREELVHGCCWYPERSVAAAWATIPDNGFLSSARIRKQFVRALFNRRGETELIVQQSQLTYICTKLFDTHTQ
jgi:hypothetical protein